MTKLHFYKAHSRLGMINIPNHGTELNLGVEDGPTAVLSTDLLAKFPGSRVTDFSFSLPEDIDKADYRKVIAKESLNFAKLINDTLEPGEAQTVIGGDHSIAFASLLASLEREGEDKVGYIQFDSHGDLHLFNTSPSGNFHGMWLRPFAGDFDSPEIKEAAKHQLRPDQILFIGNLELEPEELRFFAKNNIAQVSTKSLQESREKVLAELRDFIAKFPHLHISFDIDVFHRDYVSATGTPAPDGFSPQDIFSLIDELKSASSISLDLVEVNPQKDKADQTIAMAQKVLAAFWS